MEMTSEVYKMKRSVPKTAARRISSESVRIHDRGKWLIAVDYNYNLQLQQDS